MSHISTYVTGLTIKNEDWIKRAIGIMASKFNGISFKQMSADLIMVRYAPIEGYQRNGNMRFVKKQGVWEMQYDPFMCHGEVEKVRAAFVDAYQVAGSFVQLKQRGYDVAIQNIGEEYVLVGRRM